MADVETIIDVDTNISAFQKDHNEKKDLKEEDNYDISKLSKISENKIETDILQTQSKGENTNINKTKEEKSPLEHDVKTHLCEESNALKVIVDGNTSNKMDSVNIKCLDSQGKKKEQQLEDRVQAIKLAMLNNLCTKNFEEATKETLLKMDQFIDTFREVSCNNSSRDLTDENENVPKLRQNKNDIQSKVVNDNDVKEGVNMTELESRVDSDNRNSAFPKTFPEDFKEKKQNLDSTESKTSCDEETDILYIQNQSDIQNSPDKTNRDLKLSNTSNDLHDVGEKSFKENTPNQDTKPKIPSISKDKDHKECNILKINPNDDRSVWISNINPHTTAKNLKLDLSKFGKVVTAKIVSNGDKYYGYALMENTKYADVCISKLNGTMLNGYELEVGRETPNKKKGNLKDKKFPVGNEKTDAKKETKDKVEDLKVTEKDVQARGHIKRKRSASRDPLTLKVERKRRAKEIEESKNVEQKPKRKYSFSHRSRLTKEQELQLKKQKQLEMEIAIEKKKLAINKQQFEREKLEFLRLQTRFEEERVKQEREKTTKARELQKERDSLNARRRRSKSPKVCRREHKNEKSIKHFEERSSKDRRPLLKRPLLESPKKGNPIPVLHRGYRDNTRYFEEKLESDYAKYGRVDPPPPPRLTTDDLNTCKIKSYENKKITKTEFSPMSDINLDRGGYLRKKEKDEEKKNRRIMEFDRRLFETEPRRYSNDDGRKYSGTLDRKYSENERSSDGFYYKDCEKYKNYKRIFEENKILPLRSEISIPSARNNFQYSGNNDSRNVSYPVQYRNYPPPPVEYHVPLQHINGPNIHNNWNDQLKRPVYQKDQQSSHVRPFHQEHKYDGYDKKHQYLDFSRKY